MKLLCFAVLFCVTVKWVCGQTADVTSTVVASDCTGTLVCTLTGGPDVATVLPDTNGKIEFLKGGAVIFRVTGDGASTNDVKDASDNTLTGITAVGSGKALTLTFSSTFKMNAAYGGTDWTCASTGTAAGNTVGAGAAATVTISDVSNCASATLVIDSCAQTLTCTLTYDVASVQTGSGVIHFKKSGTVYQISTADAVTSDGSAAVTGATATAPVGTSTTDAKKATVTIGSTGTWDSTTIDGSWTCEVESATPNLWYNEISSSVTVTSGCASISIDACARTMSCTFSTNVDTLQTDNGIISFKKAGTTQFQIASANDAVTSDGSTSVTGVTASAPVGTSTTDAKIARLTFAATATFDSTLDGDWTCEVDADTATNDMVSISTTLSTTCGAAMNKIAGILVVLIVAIKALLF